MELLDMAPYVAVDVESLAAIILVIIITVKFRRGDALFLRSR